MTVCVIFGDFLLVCHHIISLVKVGAGVARPSMEIANFASCSTVGTHSLVGIQKMTC